MIIFLPKFYFYETVSDSDIWAGLIFGPDLRDLNLPIHERETFFVFFVFTK